LKIGHEIKKLSHLIDQDLFKNSNQANPGRCFFISMLDKRGGRIDQSKICGLFNRRRSTITSLVKNLEKDGLVKIEDDINDKRKKEIILTDNGKKLSKSIDDAIDSNENKLTNGLTDEEKETLLLLLNKMQKNMEG